jgi:hypothetical protein
VKVFNIISLDGIIFPNSSIPNLQTRLYQRSNHEKTQLVKNMTENKLKVKIAEPVSAICSRSRTFIHNVSRV